MNKKRNLLMMKKPVVITIGAVGCLLLLWMFTREPSKADIIGNYHRVFLGVDEALALNPEGSFEQVLVYPNGKKWVATGTWELIHNAVQFSAYNYYCDYDKMTLMNPPEHVSSVLFAVEKGDLVRDMQAPLRKRAPRAPQH